MFQAGHVKRNPLTGEVALRTHFPEDDPQLAVLAWSVIAERVGARSAQTSDVAEWDDLFVPDSEDGS
jgi:hypothetical protein